MTEQESVYGGCDYVGSGDGDALGVGDGPPIGMKVASGSGEGAGAAASSAHTVAATQMAVNTERITRRP
jgi:hypothetical protein